MSLDIAVELSKKFEGLSLKPYLCPAGVWTTGYGATFYESGRKVHPTDPLITKDRAEELLLFELEKHCLPAVLRLCPVLAGDEKKLNAIVDFTFNCGAGRLQTSTLRRRINALDWDGAKQELAKWVYGGGRKLPGLIRRRAAEAALFD